MLFRPAAKLEDLPPGAMLGVDIDDLPVLLVNMGGAVYALKNRCSHMNAPLSMGKLEVAVIECPLHRARFDVTTGKCLSPPQMGGLQSLFVAAVGAGRITENITTPDLDVYQTKVEDGMIMIGIPECK